MTMLRGGELAFESSPKIHRLLQGGGGGGGGGAGGGGGVFYGSGGSNECGAVNCAARNCLLISIAIVLLFGCLLYQRYRNKAAEQIMEVVERRHREWVFQCDEGSKTAASSNMKPGFQSGTWKGYYHQYRRNHELLAFDLKTTLGKSVEYESPVRPLQGSGYDGVGAYTITGFFNSDTGRLVFSKKYKLGTGHPNENLGHTVAYIGSVQGTVKAGIRGTWFVSTHQYEGEGVFHIWPCNLSKASFWEPNEPLLPADNNAPQAEWGQQQSHMYECSLGQAESSALAVSTFNNECVVCFEESVGTILRPCGHVALCGTCANKLKQCPLCRSDIQSVQAIHMPGNLPGTNPPMIRTLYNQCIPCCDRAVDTILHPCGHIALCESCACKLARCPLCRSVIQTHERVNPDVEPKSIIGYTFVRKIGDRRYSAKVVQFDEAHQEYLIRIGAREEVVSHREMTDIINERLGNPSTKLPPEGAVKAEVAAQI